MGFAINAVEVPVLTAERNHRQALTGPIEHRCRADIEIESIVGRHLMPPLERTGACVQHDHAVGEEIGPGSQTGREIGRWISHRHEHFTARHVERVSTPTATAAVAGSLTIGPRLGTDLFATWNGVEAPAFATTVLLEGHNAAANAPVAARRADDQ